MSWLSEGVPNWFALLKMEEGSSSSAGRVPSKIAAFGPLNAGLTFGYSTASSLSASRCVILGIIYSPLQRGCGVLTGTCPLKGCFGCECRALSSEQRDFHFLALNNK